MIKIKNYGKFYNIYLIYVITLIYFITNRRVKNMNLRNFGVYF